jgi:hypothetical protein
MLRRQQRQTQDESGVRLTRYVSFFSGDYAPSREEVAAMVDDLNNRAVRNLDALIPNNPRVVVQRNEFRHALNTRLIQAIATHNNKRLVFWRARHQAADQSLDGLPEPILQAAEAKYDGMEGLTADTWYFDGAYFLLLDNINPQVWNPLDKNGLMPSMASSKTVRLLRVELKG